MGVCASRRPKRLRKTHGDDTDDDADEGDDSKRREELYDENPPIDTPHANTTTDDDDDDDDDISAKITDVRGQRPSGCIDEVEDTKCGGASRRSSRSDDDSHQNNSHRRFTSRDDSPTSPRNRFEISSTMDKLEDTQRRRLSVSTVSQNLEDLGVFASVVAVKKSTPKKIKKFLDPALELLNETNGSVRDVSVSMLLDLFDKDSKSLLIFGAPSSNIQRGFDNKKIEVAGTMANSYNLIDFGIGYACKKGLKPESPNQDDFFIIIVDDWLLLGVFDGHGPVGHDVSNFVHKTLPFLVITDPLFDEDPCLVMKRSFRKTHHLLEALCQSAKLDCTLSGTTGTLCLQRGGKLFVAHVGDSRAVIASENSSRFKAANLTSDHKPTRLEEKKRIEESGGEVRRLDGDIPHRVFVRNRLYPGLAMSRALGDTVGAAVGVIPDPDTQITDLRHNHKFVIVATDGVWEFITSQESIDFVCQKPRDGVQKAAEFLAYESWRRWVEEEENVVDDVTCIVMWVNKDKSNKDKSNKEKSNKDAATVAGK